MEEILARAPYFVIIFIRLESFMLFVPFFDNPNFSAIPIQSGFAFMISLLLFPTIPTTSWVIPNNLLSYMFMMASEIMVGILIGLVLVIFLFALQLAGRMLGFQMAFSMANVVDVTFGSDTNVISVFMVMVGTMIFITLGGDHSLLYALKQSFTALPPGSLTVTQPFLNELSRLVEHAFVVGFKLSAPAVILLLCIDLTLGLIGKTAAKMQIFFVGLPLKIAFGLFGFALILGFIAEVWAKDIPGVPAFIMRLFYLGRG